MRILLEHLPVALAVGLMGWWVSGNYWCIIAALAAGWMVDVDHLLDFFYYIKRAGRTADYSLVRTGEYFKINNKVFVPLHAWEITFSLLFLAICFGEIRAIFICAALAHGMHLLQDQLMYQVKPFGYWLLSRYRRNFSLEGFCSV